MDSLSLVYYPAKILRTRAEDVEEITDDIRQLGRDMVAAMARFRGVGLAGPQVHVGKRIIALQDGKESLVCVNPRLVSKSKESEIQEEGCLSLPGIYANIRRSKTAIVRYLDLNGNLVERFVSGLTARIFQHEIDHLNGILIINRIGLIKRWKLRGALRQIRVTHAR